MGGRIEPKVRVVKIAQELLRQGMGSKMLPDFASMTRDQIKEALEAIVRKDRLELTDYLFRRKYINYIRHYWGGGKA